MSDTAVEAIRKPKTNLSVVTDIMEFSRYGALAQAFVMVALERYCVSVAAKTEDEVANDLIPSGVWRGVAEEILEKLETNGYRTPQSKE